ncbi:glucosamine-6-phosphate deaminase [Paenibacillus sp. JCM 10914]|uniref:glucosamine-6-phosphate deaminase n=1 Tax=Paenibacillus sp. JCM 10914 TaxID=1236974 RepID=UPI0003CC8BD4|nr:glucosamine-6-phosphate deaminase [Paenibacillus sp. JCM 10914]GAE06910.1 glucosamine-6-phosphate deaminase [Paenibacillus sp. JCM 10914]
MSNNTPIQEISKDSMFIQVYQDRASLGEAAASQVAGRIKELLSGQDRVRMIFAAAPSQNEFLRALIRDEEIDWQRIDAFHMDEYIGLPEEAPQRFGLFLKNGLFDHVRPGAVHYMDTTNTAVAECERYAALLNEAPVDIVCMGIGENGHIAFNDPPVADFTDPLAMKIVELDEACRQQQVNDGCFETLDDVPREALTLTIPTLLSGQYLYCMVPGPAKCQAVTDTIMGNIHTECPASILRTHANCTLYVDVESFDENVVKVNA